MSTDTQTPEADNATAAPPADASTNSGKGNTASDNSAKGNTANANSSANSGKGNGSKKKTTAKKSSPKPSSKKSQTPLQALQAASSSSEPQDGAQTFFLNIAEIDANDNPRHEPSNLFDAGYVLIGKHPTWEPEEVEDGEEPEVRYCLRDMALSDDLDEVREFVELIDEYETVDRKDNPNAPQSIVELADDMRRWSSVNKNGHGQFVPAFVKQERGKWALIDGGRRTTAILYNNAVDRLAKADGEEDAPARPYPAVILCLDATGVKQDQFFELSMLLNMSRKQMTPLQEGLVYFNLLQTVNPETEKKYNLKELHARYGEMLGVTYGTMRHRVALWEPHKPAVKDEKTGEVRRKARGLTDGDREKVAKGEMTPTAASRKSLGERHNTPRPAPSQGQPRRRSLPLSDIEKEFDKTPGSKKGYKQGLAFCMGISFEQAEKESDARLAAAEEAELEANAA